MKATEYKPDIRLVLCLILFAVLLSCASEASAQECSANPFERVLLIKGLEGTRVEVSLNDPVSNEYGSALPVDRIKVSSRGSGNQATPARDLTVKSVEITPNLGRRFLRVVIADAIPDDHNTVQVTLVNVKFGCPSQSNPTLVGSVAETGKIYNLDEILEEDKKALADAVAAAKTSDEKLFSGGFSLAKGEGEDAEGAADVSANLERSFNRTLTGGDFANGLLFDKAIISIQLKKATAEQADPKHLTLGLTLRKSFLLQGRSEYFKALGELGNRTPDEAALMKRQDERESGIEHYRDLKEKGFFRVLMIDESLNLENEAFQFRSTNFVSDTKIQFASIAKALGGNKGFFNMRVILGPELGRNLEKPDPEMMGGSMPGGSPAGDNATAEQLEEVDWIARFKGGVQFTLRYLPGDDLGSTWGVELDLGFVYRHLFSDEVAIEEVMENDMTTMRRVSIAKGSKSWAQADAKIFLFSSPTARYGFKLSYNHGRLPPVFALTDNAVKFGIVVETTDDKTSGASVKQ